MTKGHRFHIGMRMFKTALSISLVNLCYHFIPAASAQIASIAAVYSQRANFSQSLTFARHRLSGMVVGGLAALGTIFLLDYLPEHYLIHSLLAGLGALFTLWLCNLTHSEKAVVGASATFFIIFYTIPESNRYAYAIMRTLDTFVGGIIALGVEFILPRERTVRLVAYYNDKVPQWLQIKHR
ncbi:aromatic acid exporter family protein [Aerococcus kribbianus]|uniref:Aromatic acid exporter family protein n=1 Tax=Aerococcus kribbianus TaxID=2999064 RepID=A0A9X3JD95_9LACT|nr:MULTISPECIES: aromatic acid exporter family protein [unclassified Aerococcus]MCZ0717260.1 aromatic acid exporter family protein [Aerococcus sp. YH-aer221]MCZ0725548.1 aromatic acid exporter family protein [Aerococcus sp. YH-aer222]